MWKALNKNVRSNNGFTLIELVVVIAILGILVAIAVPRMANSREKAARSAHNANVRTIESAANMYMAEQGIPENGASKEEVQEYLQDWPKVPKGGNIPQEGSEYSVTIKSDGTIEVTPGKIPEPEDG